MQFLAIVRYRHGGRVVHEFSCPLERVAFLRMLKEKNAARKVTCKNKTVPAEFDPCPEGEEHWYPASSKGDIA